MMFSSSGNFSFVGCSSFLGSFAIAATLLLYLLLLFSLFAAKICIGSLIYGAFVTDGSPMANDWRGAPLPKYLRQFRGVEVVPVPVAAGIGVNVGLGGDGC